MVQSKESDRPPSQPVPSARWPERESIYFGLLGPPLFWAIEVTANFALASHACFPRGVPRTTFLPGWTWIWLLLLAINLVLLAASVAGLFFAYRAFTNLPRLDRATHQGDAVEPGEGRPRAFAAAGIFAGSLFSIAIAFNTFSLALLSTCSQP